MRREILAHVLWVGDPPYGKLDPWRPRLMCRSRPGQTGSAQQPIVQVATLTPRRTTPCRP